MPFTPDAFYTKHPLHQKPFTPNNFLTRQQWRFETLASLGLGPFWVGLGRSARPSGRKPCGVWGFVIPSPSGVWLWAPLVWRPQHWRLEMFVVYRCEVPGFETRFETFFGTTILLGDLRPQQPRTPPCNLRFASSATGNPEYFWALKGAGGTRQCRCRTYQSIFADMFCRIVSTKINENASICWISTPFLILKPAPLRVHPLNFSLMLCGFINIMEEISNEASRSRLRLQHNCWIFKAMKFYSNCWLGFAKVAPCFEGNQNTLRFDLMFRLKPKNIKIACDDGF